ncbi:polyamine-transporting ATPase 13A3 isoform X1 [Stomoxys calcitrans]|uniref:polyamine-transporting ATPase 13A3 isoform X1 n=1 Tax=Stomoxys calcitrans TaxID=35570 RepID=UPI0027E3AE93|nr:polyamine-transporting ATPase 13A3 isoform X1 [Stomoxys calcitrans]
MQGYMSLKDAAEHNSAPSTVGLTNGYDLIESSTQAVDAVDHILLEAMPHLKANLTNTPTTQHYTNKANVAKLQWWNTPTPLLTIDSFNKQPLNGSASPTTPSPSSKSELNFSSPHHQQRHHNHHHHTSNSSLNLKGTPTKHSHQHHHSHQTTPHNYAHDGDGDISPLSNSASSSRHKIHNHSATSDDKLSPKLLLANQFSIEEEPDANKLDSQLLLNDKKPCTGLLNPNEDDEMKITGYRRSRMRTALCWICICLTGGLLRLIMHWWRHWYLMATHEMCSLEDADKVLVQEDYKGNHKMYYVKQVLNLDINTLREQQLKQNKQSSSSSSTASPPTNKEGLANGCNNVDATVPDIDEKNFHLSMHFATGQFKYCSSARIFNCKQLRYAWNAQTQTFDKLQGLDVDISNAYFHQQHGLSHQEQVARRLVYGPNEITVPYKDVKTLLFLEVLNPFYVFQIFSVILWFAYDYYYYACVIVLMSVFGITMSIVQTKKNQDALRETVQNTGTALIVGERGEVQELPTQRLVPGDIIEIPSSGCIMQCDAVLLSGNCILDEAMLTGESVPVTKTPLPSKRDVVFDKKEHARHTLFCGTKVIQTRYIGSEKVLALVINTGNITAKGGLIRSILYPPPVDYKFEQDSYKFIEFLGVIALIGFVYTLISKIMRNVDPVKIAVESLDLITIVVPPALPAAMTVGRFYAQKRLERNNIYCISPRSINVAGSIDCCCFDKTGTLTEDGLDMWGVVPKSATNQFQIPIKQIERLPFDHFLFGMVTCHSITIMNNKMMGDPLDLKMFESTGWILEDAQGVPDTQKYGLLHPTVVRPPKTENPSVDDDEHKMVERQSSVDDLLSDVGLLNGEAVNDHGIVREFPFTSNLQRMSVITRRLSEKHFNVYCKGSPEMLQQLCIPQSIPDNFSQQLSVYAKQGYRVIALAYKPLSTKVNYTKVQRLPRESAESDLLFLGFVVLENRLKPDTSDVIGALTKANVRTIMVTGDNILTALSVARDCGIVSSNQAVVTVNVRQKADAEVCEHNETADHNNYELYYTLDLGSASCASTSLTNGKTNGTLTSSNTNDSMNYDTNYHRLNGDVASLSSAASITMPNSKSCGSVETVDTWTHNDVELGLTTPLDGEPHVQAAALSDKKWRDNYRFAMVGKTWQIVKDHYPELLSNFLSRGVIYARMSPEQKQALVVELQGLDYCVAMCGDGANDCGALKVAHTGISLSETESSIASPFTSRNPTIAAVPNVIKEGRAALVTSFGIFKYMAAYSLVQFVSVMILYSIDSNLTDKQYLYVDLGLISIFAFFFGKTESFNGPLVKQVPLSSLISLTPLVSIVLHLLVAIAFQVTGWFHVHHQDWFEPFEHSNDEHLGCWENYTIFAISSFQYIILAFVFSKGAPYRRPIWSNLPFCLTLVVNLCIVIYLLIYPPVWLSDFFQLILPPEMPFRYWMLVYGAGSFVAHVVIETLVVEYLLFKKFQARRDNDARTSSRRYMQIEYDLKFYKNWPQITEVVESNPVDSHQNKINPAYFEISAEQNFDTPVSDDNNPLNSFFEMDPMTPTSTEAPLALSHIDNKYTTNASADVTSSPNATTATTNAVAANN